jgi:hypothetical protein
VLALLVWIAAPGWAQETKSARGTVTAMAVDSLTVKAGTSELKLMVDAKTRVIAEGGGTAAREAQAKGATGPKFGDVIKVGQAVEVRYVESGGTMHATEIRRVASAGSGGGTTSDQRAAERSETASGTVESISASALTITGAGGGGSTFKQTFTIDAKTTVVGEGVGTAAAAKGGKIVFTDHVTKGDRVTVTYRTMGNMLHAEQVRVTQKAK